MACPARGGPGQATNAYDVFLAAGLEVEDVDDGPWEWRATGYSSAVAKGIFIFNQGEFSGNIWMLK